MGLETLLASFRNDVTAVTSIHPSNRKAPGCYASKKADVTAVTADPSLGMPRRLWLIRHGDGSLWSHSFTPPATLAMVQALHPEALEIEVEEVSAS